MSVVAILTLASSDKISDRVLLSNIFKGDRFVGVVVVGFDN